jgi:hypothetical protein
MALASFPSFFKPAPKNNRPIPGQFIRFARNCPESVVKGLLPRGAIGHSWPTASTPPERIGFFVESRANQP